MTAPAVAAIQMSSGNDRAENFATAKRLLAQAAAAGATLAVLPEMFGALGSGHVLRHSAEPLDGPTSQFARAEAERLDIWLLAGSFIEAEESGTRANTSLLVSPTGEVVAVYRKVHLFDVEVPGAEFRESDVTRPGDELVVADIEGLGILGMSICYDLRFPELYRILTLNGADLVVVPAAFTAKTGHPHWEVLLRARAIENQVYVIAAAQHGSTVSPTDNGASSLSWHGHSMIIDPWGTVVAQAPGFGDAVITAKIESGHRDEIRRIIPSLENRRPTAYRWP